MLDFLTLDELQLMQSDGDDYVRDAQFAGTVLYQSFVSAGTVDPSTGRRVPTYAGTWVHAVRTMTIDQELPSTETRYQMGLVTYEIRSNEVSVPKKDDRIIDLIYGPHEVIGYVTDMPRILHSILARNPGNV